MRKAVFLLCAGAAVFAAATAETNGIGLADSLGNTNDVKVAKALEAMKVEEKEEADETKEAAEVAEVVRRAEAEKQAEKADPWEAFAPPVDREYDWLQLTSGEWLKGEFKVMYDLTLEFDSDELDVLEFDFEDVRQLRTRGMQSVFIEGEDNRRDTSILRGMLVIDGDQVVLRRAEHEVSFPRDRIISIAGGRQREKDYWSGTLSVGINAREGNTDTLDTTVQAMVRRRTARTRIQADYLANYSETQNIETAEDQRLTAFHDWFLTGRFYWKVLEAEIYRDPFSNIDGQYSAATGVGYDIIQTPRTEWTVNTGAGYQELRFVSVQPGEDQSSSSPFFTAGTRMDFELNQSVDLLYDYSLRVLNEDNGQYTHQMKAALSFDLIGDLDIDVSAIWDRIEKPQLDDNGVRPERDDFQLIVSLAYDF